MATTFTDLYNVIADSLTYSGEFFTQGIYNVIYDATAWLILYLTKLWWETKLLALQFSWNVAQSLLGQIGVSSVLSTYWNSLNPTLLSFLVYLKIPDFINIIVSAYSTKFVMSFLGFNK